MFFPVEFLVRKLIQMQCNEMESSKIRGSCARKVLPAFAGSDFAVICVALMGAGTVCGLPWGLWGDNKGQPGSCA